MHSFDDHVREYSEYVYNYILRLSGSREEANDLTQDTFVKAWRSFASYDRSKKFSNWILTIARNTTYDYLRKKRSYTFTELDQSKEDDAESFGESLADPEPLPDELFRRRELVHELEKTLKDVRPADREIIILHHISDLTFQEIADMLNISINTVTSRYRRALQKIRTELHKKLSI